MPKPFSIMNMALAIKHKLIFSSKSKNGQFLGLFFISSFITSTPSKKGLKLIIASQCKNYTRIISKVNIYFSLLTTNIPSRGLFSVGHFEYMLFSFCLTYNIVNDRSVFINILCYHLSATFMANSDGIVSFLVLSV